MPSRRSHTKSRLGCKQCKTRKVKCDELRPVCGNCSSHNVSCDFALPNISVPTQTSARLAILPFQRASNLGHHWQGASSAALTHRPKGFRPGTQSPSLSSTIPTQIGTPPERFLDLRLLHHYISMSSENNLSASGDYPGRTHPPNVWSVWVQGLAIKSPSLMDALLGFSAFHLRSQNPSDQVMARASHSHMVRAISEHAKVLRGGVNADNAQVLFATSTFIAFHAFAGQRFLHGSEEPLYFHDLQALTIPNLNAERCNICRQTVF